MYRLRDMDIDDKVCEQVEMTMLRTVYPKEVIKKCVQQSQPWSTKARRVRQSTALALVLFVIEWHCGVVSPNVRSGKNWWESSAICIQANRTVS